MDSLIKLRKLTEELPEVPTLDSLVNDRDIKNHSIIYDVSEGTSFGLGLLSRKEVAVQELFISKGTMFPSHIHIDENEWGIIYKGKLQVTLDGEDVVLEPGNCNKKKKGVVHSSLALSDCWMIAVAVPKISGYPE